MRRKVLQSYVNTFVDVFLGWRGRCDDDISAALGDGTLVFDVLTGAIYHNGTPVDTPSDLASFLPNWLRRQAERDRVSLAEIGRAALELHYTVTPEEWEVPIWSLEYQQIRGEIETDQRTYLHVVGPFSCSTQRSLKNRVTN